MDLSGLMEVLGHHLYSTPLVALRELVQNGHDSCLRRRVEDPSPFTPRITVVPDAVAGTVSIIDTGAGLTRDEIIRYLATAGSGYTRKLRAADGQAHPVGGGDWAGAAPIGQFGLGFLSAFFVSDRVEVWTTSYQEPEVGWRFLARGAERFEIEPAPPRAIGTEVRLHVSRAYQLLADPTQVRPLLARYCGLLPLPVHLGEGPPINDARPPWRGATADRDPLSAVNRSFAARFERAFEPICVFPLPAGGVVQGLVWVQSGGTLATSDNRHVSVFVRGMLVSDDARELLPAWAGFCGAVLESDQLRPTASREDLQKDATWEQARDLVLETLVAGLSTLARTSPSAWRLVLGRHAEALLGAAVGDEELFDALRDDLKVPTSEGDWTLPALRSHSRKQGRDGRIYVTLGQKGSYEEMLFRAMKVPVVEGTRFAALPFTERYAERSGLTVVRIGTREGDAAIFRPANASDEVVEVLEDVFGGEARKVHPVRFQPSWLPVVLVPDRETELKQRIESDDADRRITGSVLGLARLYVASLPGDILTHVYVNLACPAVEALIPAPPDRRERAGRLLRATAELMGGHEEHVGIDIERSLRDLGELARELAGAAVEPAH